MKRHSPPAMQPHAAVEILVNSCFEKYKCRRLPSPLPVLVPSGMQSALLRTLACTPVTFSRQIC